MDLESITLISYFAAFAGGVVSFLSPCVRHWMPITAFYDAEGSLDFVAQGGLVDGALFEQLRRFGYIS